MSDMLSNVRFNRCYGAFLGYMSGSALELLGYHFHHSALGQGYCKIAKPDCFGFIRYPVYQYNGRFGSGVVQFVHNPDSTEYLILMYYIRS